MAGVAGPPSTGLRAVSFMRLLHSSDALRLPRILPCYTSQATTQPMALPKMHPVKVALTS